MSSRKWVAFSAGVVGLVLGAASLAWACTITATVFAAEPSFGPPGSQVSLTGQALWTASPTPTPLELRWNGADGATIGRAVADQAGNFSVAAPIPDVPPGVYSLVAVFADGGQAVVRTAFSVTGSADHQVQAVSAPGGAQPEASRSVPPGNSTDGLAVGMGVLAVGLVALFSGFTVVGLRRRRALVGTHR